MGKWMDLDLAETYGGKTLGPSPYQQNEHVREVLGLNVLGSKEGAVRIERQIFFLRRHKQLGSCFHVDNRPDKSVEHRRKTARLDEHQEESGSI